MSGYKPTRVEAQNCGTFTAGGMTYNPQRVVGGSPPTSSPSTGGNGGGGNVPPSYTPDNPQNGGSPQSTNPNITDEDGDESDANEKNNFDKSLFDLNIPFSESGIQPKISSLKSSIDTKLQVLGSDVYLDCNKLVWVKRAKCEGAFYGAQWNLFMIFCRLIFGVLKGAGFAVLENFVDFMSVGPSVVVSAQEQILDSNKSESFFFQIANYLSFENLKNIAVVSGEYYEYGCYYLLDRLIQTANNTTNEQYQNIFEHIGYWIGYAAVQIGIVAVAVISTADSLGTTSAWIELSLARLGKIMLSGFNFAKSLVTINSEIRIDTLAIKNIINGYKNVSIYGQEIGRLSTFGNATRTARLTESTNQVILALKNRNSWIISPTNFIQSVKQNRHIIGTAEYIEGRSILSANADNLLAEFGGKGMPRTGNLDKVLINQEFVDCGRVIGIFKDKNGVVVNTSKIIIKYSKNGAHIVPSRP